MIRIYGCSNPSHRSMINRFIQSAGAKLPTDLRVEVEYHRRRKSGIFELLGWRIYRTGSKSVLCAVSVHDNNVDWIRRGKILKSEYLSDHIGVYTSDIALEYPKEKEAE